ncbi:SDR family oxidoreductase [Conexibacter sp. DBS9H8]|uniref:SDR family oxidoreductase n=1 Tax=Conexibacter sp. DBS9H8 TaxID=2937801 RepID=UPI00200F63B2|nr:SDR family oxidoreductase [Conexibacter sp. DBS9H8]
MTKSLAGKVVAVTGGARGIGRATAETLITRGARVAIGDIDGALAQTVAEELGHGSIGCFLDVTDVASFEVFLEQTERELGPLDVLINNAGIMPLGAFVEETEATAERMIDINLNGVILGSKLALRRFQARGEGHLVNIASTAGKYGAPGGATYAATKHAVVGLSEAIRQEVAGTGIGVSIVMPLVVNTDLGSGLSGHGPLKVLEPSDVATAIVEAIEHNRVDVYVPSWIGLVLRVQHVLPRAVNDRVIKLLGADKVLTETDPGRRDAYESHVAADADAHTLSTP